MISPMESLAFSMHANPGVYAVLAGSGISRAAKIPTGWEITLDLVRKLAVLREDECDPDPEQWFSKTFGKEPNYSDLLNDLFCTSSEKQQVLSDYIEPSLAEREEGAKQPTAAHRAIAALAAKGFIRVIVTTNFDRLIETALEDVGVTPTVLATPDQVQGALPLIHTGCCVVKLHGDYRDTRIRNTQAELDSYPPEFDTLLDRVFEEFGLLVCGWSAAWDGALRDALSRASSRRFTTYWTLHGEVADEARRLIEHRRGESIEITDADEFFSGLHEHVESLEEFARPHPLSTEAAVTSLKRYLPEPRYRIRLSELVDGVVEEVVRATSGEEFSIDGPRPDQAATTARVHRYDAACSTLLALGAVGGRWAEEDHVFLWQGALGRLGAKRHHVGTIYTVWENLNRYPASMLLYALGLGALHSDRLHFFGQVLKTSLPDDQQEDTTAVHALASSLLDDGSGGAIGVLEGTSERAVPLYAWMRTTLRSHLAAIIRDDRRYRFVFDYLEFVLALGYAHAAPGLGWVPMGSLTRRSPNTGRIVEEIEGSLVSERDNSRFVQCGIFGDTSEVCRQRLAAVQQFIAERRWY